MDLVLSGRSVKLLKLCESLGFRTLDQLEPFAVADGPCPAICMTEECDKTCKTDKHEANGYCDACGGKTVVSAVVLAGLCEARKERNAVRIRELNDAFRTTLRGGSVMMTPGVAELPDCVKADVVSKVVSFGDFTEDNDPHGEHDFGSFDVVGRKFFWKIDYYDRTLTGGADDPADPDKTSRVLTIMLAGEY